MFQPFQRLRKWLCRCPHQDEHPEWAVRLIPVLSDFRTTDGIVEKTPQFQCFPLSGEIDMATEMTTIDQFKVTIKPKNKKGGPAQLDSTNQPPEWLTSNSDVLALTPSDDKLSCTVKATGVPGSATWQFTGDADLGTGVSPIVATGEVNVAMAPATTVEAEVGAVEEQP